MSNTLQWLLISVLSVVIILILIYNVSPTLFKFDFISFISQIPANLGDIFQPKDLSQAKQYEGYESSYAGMILKKDAGYDNIDEALKSKVTIPDCSICPSSNCQPITLGGINTYKCNGCGICNGISQPGRFNNCLGCDTTKETCVMCTDTSEEYALCNKVKSCILDLYSTDNKNGCFIGEISHNDGTSFNINTLQSVLSSCKDESIKVNMGNNFTKELCYFNSSSISYYDFERPNDFYLNYSVHCEGCEWAQSDSLNLAPFYKEGEQTLSKYRIYVAINGTPDTEYTITIGKYPVIGLLGVNNGYSAELGKIKTDSTGFGHGDFIDIPEKASACEWVVVTPYCWDVNWKDEPEKNPIKGVSVSPTPQYIYATFYANSPASNGVWTNELRYPNCNFNTDPEPYLKDRPWWVSNPDNLDSSWYITNGNPNSSIKVFYDSSIPGGGNSLNRGNIKIQLGRLDVNFQRNCKFDIYACSQDAFAEYNGEGILSLNDFLTNFNPINVYGTRSFGNNVIILYNYFELDLDKSYTVEEIKSAIKTGFRNWEQNLFPYLSSSTSLDWLKNNDGIYQGSWIDTTRSLLYENDCWDSSLNLIMDRLNGKFIIGNCQNNICKGKIKIRIAFKYIKPDSSNPDRNFLYPTVTFCDASNAPATPPNPCSSYASDSGCIFNGCRWCPSYGGISNGCGDASEGMLDPCVGSECFTTAQCTDPSGPLPTCTWRDKYVDLLKCGIGCCDDAHTCTVPAANCY